MLNGDDGTNFIKAKSRLFAWLNRIHRMQLPVPPLDDLVDKLGGPNVRDFVVFAVVVEADIRLSCRAVLSRSGSGTLPVMRGGREERGNFGRERGRGSRGRQTSYILSKHTKKKVQTGRHAGRELLCSRGVPLCSRRTYVSPIPFSTRAVAEAAEGTEAAALRS